MPANPAGPKRWTRHLSGGGFCGGAVLAVVLVLSWLGAGTREAPGYAFRPSSYERPGARPEILWSPEVWAPGQTLSITLVDSPEWERDFGSTANAARFLDREVLGAWAAIETADIRWEIGRVAGEDESLDATDSYLHRDQSTYGRAVTRGGNIVACQVSMAQSYELYRDHPKGEDEDEVLRFVAIARHEFGHCLGLYHSGTTTDRPWGEHDDQRLPMSVSQRWDPLMSYGSWRGALLTVDDGIGASLIRPRPGWIETTGGIRGLVLPDDEGEARFLYVLANRLGTDGRPVESVGAMTNEDGLFFIAGLAPGQYALTVRPMYIAIAAWRYFGPVTLDILPSIRARPVTVHAGEPRGFTVLRVRRGAESPTWGSRGYTPR